MGVGYDISASASNSSAANPIAKFGNVIGGGSIPMVAWIVAGVVALFGLVYFLRRK